MSEWKQNPQGNTQRDVDLQTNMEYLERHQVYDLFRHCLDQLSIHQPKDPYSFLIDLLRLPPSLYIFVFGPPGSNKGTLCDLVAEQLGVVHVSPGRLIKAEIKKKTPIGNQAQAYVSRGELVPDDIMVPLMVKKLSSPECIQKGWIVNNFPATPTQAWALQNARIVANKYVWLDMPLEDAANRINQTRSKSADASHINTMLTCYSRYIHHIIDFYKELVHVIDMSQAQQVANQVLEYLRTPVSSSAPKIPHRIIMAGGVGAGKSTQARLLCRDLDLIHISMASLLREYVARYANQGVPSALEISQHMEAGTLVPDDLVIEILRERFQQNDVKQKGWVLDGYPRTLMQARALFEMKAIPNRYILLETSDDVLLDRINAHRVDPITQQVYNLRVQVPSDKSIQTRLLPIRIKSGDVHVALQIYNQNKQPLLELFQSIVRNVDASLTINNVAKLVKKSVEE